MPTVKVGSEAVLEASWRGGRTPCGSLVPTLLPMPIGVDGLSAWLRVFLRAVGMAVEQAADFARSLDELRCMWERNVANRRRDQNLREAPRADSATSRILETLQEHPVL